MFKENFEENCKSLCSYFEKTFKYDSSRFAHSIILYGLNAQLSYEFALELARILNCTGNKNADCTCWNCNNINTNQHPAVQTYSNLSNKTSSKESQNVITIEQIHNLCNEITVSSQYKRVYIICGEEKNGDIYNCLPLTTDILRVDSANALLKSIEEPPLDTYFIFITKDKNDLLPTIISRSQSFYVNSKINSLEYVDGLDNIFRYYPFSDYVSSKEFIQNLQNWQLDNDLDIQDTLVYAQDYLRNILKTNISDVILTNKITSDIMKFESAIKQSQNNFSDKIIWENLTYKIYKD